MCLLFACGNNRLLEILHNILQIHGFFTDYTIRDAFAKGEIMLADFNAKTGIAGGEIGQMGDATSWIEVSDNILPLGISKADLVVQDTLVGRI